MHLTTFLIEAHIFRQTENKELEFLLLKRAEGEKYSGIWQMVTGSNNQKEKAFESALREIKEETNLTPVKFWVVPNVNSFYEPNKDYICMVPVFAALVKSDSQVKISAEHSDYKWVPPEEAKLMLAWDGQKKSVDIIYEYFTNKQSLLNFIEIKL